jgi:hypothetical protein
MAFMRALTASGGGGSELVSKQYTSTTSGEIRTLTTDIDFSQYDHVFLEFVSSTSSQPYQNVVLKQVSANTIKFWFIYGTSLGTITGAGAGSLTITMKVYGVNE